MATPTPRDRPLDGLMRKASPDGDLLAKQALHKLQSALFGKTREKIKLGRYVIEERVGAGGSGVVYRAFDPKHDRKVALKLLHAGTGPGFEAARDRLLREAQSLSKLSHPNVVRIFDVGTYDPATFDDPEGGPERAPTSKAGGLAVFVAMEFLDGTDLGHWRSDTPRRWTEILDVFLDAGRGLAAAHELGLIHRDFKPANVSIGADGRVVVLDFGLARPIASHIPDPSMRMTEGAQQRLEALARPLDATLTAPGTLLGTPAYMAPEQHELERATVLSDQYSFCLALYEAWYGHRPFLATTEEELRKAKRQGKVLPAPEGTEVPSRCYDALVRGLSPHPEDRFESMNALLDTLRAQPEVARSRWRPATLVVLGAGVVLAAGLGVWALGSSSACERTAWDEAWNEQTREDLLRTAEASEPPYVAKAAARVADRLDTFAQAGAEHERAHCQGDELDAATRGCETRARERFIALVSAAREADGQTLLRAESLLRRWPAPLSCHLEGDEAPTRLSVAETLAEVHLLQVLGRLDEARVRLDQAQAEAEPLGDAALELEVTALRGHLALVAGRRDEAEAALTETLWSGESSDLPEPTARAAIDLLELARSTTPAPTDAPLWIRQAREQAAMPELPVALRLGLYLGLGRLMLAQGDPRRARVDLEQALQLEVDEQADAAALFDVRVALAEALERDDDVDGARAVRTEARAQALPVLGEGHPRLAR